MTNPDPADRPKLVVWAYRLWLTSGVLLIALGVLYAVFAVVNSGPTLEPLGVGVIFAIVGVAYCLMGSKAFVGDANWRSSLAALTLVAVVMLLFLSFFAFSLAFALLAAVIGLFGSLLAYRPESETWYTGEPPAPREGKGPRKGKGGKKAA